MNYQRKEAILSIVNHNLKTYFCDIPHRERPFIANNESEADAVYLFTPDGGEILTFDPEKPMKEIIQYLTCQVIKIKLQEDRNYELPEGINVDVADNYDGGFAGASICFPNLAIFISIDDADDDYLIREGMVADKIKTHEEEY